jgi:transcriptional regulator with XRE-family HTH domain
MSSIKSTQWREVGERLRIARKSIPLTQQELAEKTGLSDSHISLIEKGERQPSVAATKLLCGVLRISERWLLTGKEPTGVQKEMTGDPIDKQLEQLMKHVREEFRRVLANTTRGRRVAMMEHLRRQASLLAELSISAMEAAASQKNPDVRDPRDAGRSKDRKSRSS